MKQEIKILATNGDELVFTHDDANILLSINGTSPVIAKDHELFDADYNDGRFERNCKSLAKDYGYIKGWPEKNNYRLHHALKAWCYSLKNVKTVEI